jgi:hypothetical protein
MEKEFDPNKAYFFTATKEVIEENNMEPVMVGDKIYLGKFINYIGVFYVNEWLDDGKAHFQFGTIPKNYYSKIIEA